MRKDVDDCDTWEAEIHEKVHSPPLPSMVAVGLGLLYHVYKHVVSLHDADIGHWKQH